MLAEMTIEGVASVLTSAPYVIGAGIAGYVLYRGGRILHTFLKAVQAMPNRAVGFTCLLGALFFGPYISWELWGEHAGASVGAAASSVALAAFSVVTMFRKHKMPMKDLTPLIEIIQADLVNAISHTTDRGEKYLIEAKASLRKLETAAKTV